MYRLQHLAVSLFLLALAPAAFTQAVPPAPPAAAAASTPPVGTQTDAQTTSIPTVRVRSDEVNVVFTVVDKNGRFVRDMKSDQFRILDNHLPPQKILEFRAQTDL